MQIDAGLCARCRHASCTKHPRGGKDYWRCRLAEIDPRFERYPRLPVIACAGYEADHRRPGEEPSTP